MTETVDSLLHPIPYKTIIKHYDHVWHLITASSQSLSLNSSSNRSLSQPPGTAHPTNSASSALTPLLKWPPDDDIIQAAGGVGFGCLSSLAESSNQSVTLSGGGRQDSAPEPVLSDKIQIPPVIRYLHPKLTSTSYSRCRNDPLFHYKTVSVCEPCYLVYAEFSTLLLRLDGDLSKLVGGDPPPNLSTTSLPRPLAPGSVSSAQGKYTFTSAYEFGLESDEQCAPGTRRATGL
eukprot:gene901-1006_t